MKIFCPLSMHGTVFTDPPYIRRLAEAGVTFANSLREADVLIGSRIRPMLPVMALHPARKFLLWTNEPRCSNAHVSPVRPFLLFPQMEVMNVFTGDIFWHNLHFLGSYHFDTTNDLGIDLGVPMPEATGKDLAVGKKDVCALFTYRLDRNNRFVVDGQEVDLEAKRCEYAGALHAQGLCDIFGHNWPAGVATKESSGYGFEKDQVPWWVRKLEVLEGYRFNLCLENTSAAYYCTEKIWHAIRGGTLPIYDSRLTRIHETFPADSFLDLAAIESPDALTDCLRNLSDDEYLERLNRCRRAYNEALAYRRETIANDPPLHMEKLLSTLRRFA